MRLFNELKRRDVFKVGVAYLITAWVVAQVSDVFLNNLGAPPWVVRTVLLLLIAGFPVALIVAWAYELTPHGLRKESAAEDESLSERPTAALHRLIGVVVVLAVLVAVATHYFASPPPFAVANDKSVAVLPFADHSEAQDQQWFADGLAAEIINALTKTPDILASSRTSASRHTESGLTVEEIGEQLGVAHVLEGSVRRSGDNVRVTAQLVRVSDGFHIWSNNYDRELASVINIQEDIALQIARALQTSMDPEALTEMLRVGTRSVEAYDLYLRGLVARDAAYNQRDPELFVLAYEYFEAARSLDPEFGAAHFFAAQYWYVQLSPIRVFSDLSQDPPLQRKAEFDLRIEAAIRNAANNTDESLFRATSLLVDMKLRESIRYFRNYIEDRPQHLTVNFSLTDAAAFMGDHESELMAARLWYERGAREEQAAAEFLSTAFVIWDPESLADFALVAVERYPDALSLRYAAHRALLWAGRIEDAGRIQPRWGGFEELPNSAYLVEIRQACAEGRRADAEASHDEMMARDAVSEVAQFLGLSMLGDTDGAHAAVAGLASDEVPYSQATFLAYAHFDPSYFPGLIEILEREGSTRLGAIAVPYNCPAE